MENKKIKIDLGFASLVVEAGNDQMKEVYVGLEDSNGAWFQDLTVIGQKYHVDGENIATRVSASVSLLIKTTRTTLIRSILTSSKIKARRSNYEKFWFDG